MQGLVTKRKAADNNDKDRKGKGEKPGASMNMEPIAEYDARQRQQQQQQRHQQLRRQQQDEMDLRRNQFAQALKKHIEKMHK